MEDSNLTKYDVDRLGQHFKHLSASERLTVWEARQLILAEVYEYVHAPTSEKLGEACDVIGNLKYLGLSLFLQAVELMIKRDPKLTIIMNEIYVIMRDKDFQNYCSLRLMEPTYPKQYKGSLLSDRHISSALYFMTKLSGM